jgi:hypothetical protein
VRTWTWAGGLALSVCLLGGCSTQAAATDELIHALSESHSAIASSLLAIQLYEEHRSTRAATETLLEDMAGQIVDAESAVEPVKIDSTQLQTDRDATLGAIQNGVAALLTSRDELQQHGVVQSTAGLESAGGQVDSILGQLRGGR